MRRELEHVLKRSLLTARGAALTVHDLALGESSGSELTDRRTRLEAELARLAAAYLALGSNAEGGVLEQAVSRLERALVRAALASADGNQVAAARLLGVSRTTLRAKLAEPGEPE